MARYNPFELFRRKKEQRNPAQQQTLEQKLNSSANLNSDSGEYLSHIKQKVVVLYNSLVKADEPKKLEVVSKKLYSYIEEEAKNLRAGKINPQEAYVAINLYLSMLKQLGEYNRVEQKNKKPEVLGLQSAYGQLRSQYAR